MTFRERAEKAIREGWDSSPGDRNPYAGGDSLALAKCWMRGHRTMLTIRSAATPAMQRYLAARAVADSSSNEPSAPDRTERRSLSEA